MKKIPQPHGPETEYIDVQPTSLEELHLGTFSAEEQVPQYKFDCVPDIPDNIAAHLATTETTEGNILAVYHIQNYGHETVRIFPRKVVEE